MPLLIAFAFLVILFWPEETSTRASPLAIWAGNGGNGYTLASLPVFGKGDALPKSQERAPFDGWDITGSIDPAQAPEVPLDDVCTTLASAAEASELPLPFFARLIWQESRFRQRAVSPVGAQGVAQFMPKVAAELGLDDPFDPIAALPAFSSRVVVWPAGTSSVRVHSYDFPWKISGWSDSTG